MEYRRLLGTHRDGPGVCCGGQGVPRGAGRPSGCPYRAGVLEYQEKFDEAHHALYEWDVWAAAYLIGGGCSDDSFIDFRAGLIAQGRDWYQKAADSPDNLAEHPAVAATDGRPWDNPLFYEVVNYAASRAFERVSGDEHGFWDALGARDRRDRMPADMGEDFDFDDEQEMRRRLTRLAALCLGDNAALCRTGSSEAAQRTSHRSPGNDPNRRYRDPGFSAAVTGRDCRWRQGGHHVPDSRPGTGTTVSLPSRLVRPGRR
jgi:Protein of unknown function (DUF4240)